MRKIWKKGISMLVTMSMVLSLMPVMAFADGCNHVHDENCGYVAAVEEYCGNDFYTDCDHSDCGYIPAQEAVECGVEGCTHETGDCGYVAAVEEYCGNDFHVACDHTDCGYIAPQEGSECTHECDEDCGGLVEEETEDESAELTAAEELNARIAALPSAEEIAEMCEEEKDDLYYGEFMDISDAIDTAFEEWDADMLDELDLETFAEVQAALTASTEKNDTDDHKHYLCGDASCTEQHDGENSCTKITFTEWDETGSLPTEGGNFYLTGDVELSDKWVIEELNIVLCLNGHNITPAEGEDPWPTMISVGGDSEAGTLTLCDCGNEGTLSGYTTRNNRGYVCVKNGSTFNMYGGAISNNEIDTAGGVYVESSTFNMYGGMISDNVASDIAGGVYVSGGTFNMYDGEISGNESATGGGGVLLSSGAFNMKGGSITGNKVTGNGHGGGVRIWGSNDTTFNMSGGEISDNIAGSGHYGGGVYHFGGNAGINVSGNAKIIGNTNYDGSVSNLYLNNENTTTMAKISVGTLENDASIGVTTNTQPTEDSPVVFTSGGSAYVNSSIFVSDEGHGIIVSDNNLALGYVVKYNITVDETENGTVTASAQKAAEGTGVTITVSPDEGYELASLTVVGNDVTNGVNDGEYTFDMPASDVKISATFKEVVTATHTCSYISEDVTNEVEITASTTELGAGYFYIPKDGITATENIVVSDAAVICLNGQTWDLDSRTITVNSGASLTICDCGAEITNASAAYDSKDIETYTYQNGGGKIVGSNDGNGLIINSGTFTLNSGIVEYENTKETPGYNVSSDDGFDAAVNGGKIIINGGSVIAEGVPAVYTKSATGFTMNGGYVESDANATVYVYNSSNSKITDGVIKNTAKVCPALYGDNAVHAAAVFVDGTYTNYKFTVENGLFIADAIPALSSLRGTSQGVQAIVVGGTYISNIAPASGAAVEFGMTSGALNGDEINIYAKISIETWNQMNVLTTLPTNGKTNHSDNVYTISRAYSNLESGALLINSDSSPKQDLSGLLTKFKHVDETGGNSADYGFTTKKDGGQENAQIWVHKHTLDEATYCDKDTHTYKCSYSGGCDGLSEAHDLDKDKYYAATAGEITAETKLAHICAECMDPNALVADVINALSDVTVEPSKTEFTVDAVTVADIATVTGGTITPTIKDSDGTAEVSNYAATPGTYRAYYAENAYVVFTVQEKAANLAITVSGIDEEVIVKIKLGDTTITDAGDITFTDGEASVEVTGSKTIALPVNTTYEVSVDPMDGYVITTSGTTGTIVAAGNTVTITYSKTKVQISVVDSADNEKLKDATIQILDGDDKAVAEWTSDENVYAVEGLKTETEYTLHVETAIDGYANPEDATIYLNKDGSINDEKTTAEISEDGDVKILLVKLSKTAVAMKAVDVNGTQLGDVALSVADYGEYKTSATENNTVEGLTAGVTYTIHTETTPDGYAAASDVTITLNADGTINTDKTTATVENGVVVIQIWNSIPVDRNGDGVVETGEETATVGEPDDNGTYKDAEGDDKDTYIPVDTDGDGDTDHYVPDGILVDSNEDGLYTPDANGDSSEDDAENGPFYIAEKDDDGNITGFVKVVDSDNNGVYGEDDGNGKETENDNHDEKILPDQDGDGKPEVDDDGDGIFDGSKDEDAEEGPDNTYIPDQDGDGKPEVDDDGDGIYDGTKDENDDGEPDNVYIPVDGDPNDQDTKKDDVIVDSDGDGIFTEDENNDGKENDEDGDKYVPEGNDEGTDPDKVVDNNDGTYTEDLDNDDKADEGGTSYIPDQDGDHVAEPDTNDDGIYEGTDSTNEYIPSGKNDDNYYVDSNDDGIFDEQDENGAEKADDNIKYIPDQDGDGKPEPDTNGDGIFEGTEDNNDYIPSGNGDGNYYVDDNDDGVFDEQDDETGFEEGDKDADGKNTTYIPDQDSDGKPEADTDDDGVYDGTKDGIQYIPDQDGDEQPEPDTDCDGIFEGTNSENEYVPSGDNDGNYYVDSDDDGIFAPDYNGGGEDGTEPDGAEDDELHNFIPVDTNNDRVKDDLVIDADWDGIYGEKDDETGGEAENGTRYVPVDTDSDGKIDGVIEVKPNGDGTYTDPGADGTAGTEDDGYDYLPDQDHDELPEPDTNGDGIYEGTDKGYDYIPDHSGDGIPEADLDGDGIFEEDRERDGVADEGGNRYVPVDGDDPVDTSDDDGKKENAVVDSNNDGIFDKMDASGDEADDDNTYYIPDDSDGDGVVDGVKEVTKNSDDGSYTDKDGNDYIPDQDGDGKAETDTDGDGRYEGSSNGKNYVSDGNGGFKPYSTSSGGSGGSNRYSITVDEALKDKIKVNKTRAKKGTEITVTVLPGVDLDENSLHIGTKTKDVELTKNDDGTYSFKMPSYSVTVSEKAAGTSDAAELVTIILTIDSKIIKVNDEFIVYDVAPVIRNERTVLPIRIVAEKLGAQVAWDETAQKVTITKGETVIELFINQPYALVNGTPIQLDAPAFIENSRTYLPLRFVSENLGAAVTWDDLTRTVTIIG